MQVVSNNVHIERLLQNLAVFVVYSARLNGLSTVMSRSFFLTVKLEIKCISIVAHA